MNFSLSSSIFFKIARQFVKVSSKMFKKSKNRLIKKHFNYWTESMHESLEIALDISLEIASQIVF